LGRNKLEQQAVAHITKMIHRRMHLNDKLKDLLGVAGFFKKFNSQLANFRSRIVELRDEQPQSPGIRVKRFTNEGAEMFCCIESDML
jgi:hypothetical protein